jgi:Lon protease-like protein
MFIGHLALGFAAKRAVPNISLAVLFVAVQLADMLWPIFVAAGIEHVRIDPGNTAVTPLDFVNYPYSHSLAFLLIWGIAFGALYRFAARDRSALLILAALVVSHWVLDFVTHRPDMPIYPGGAKYGLGLWNSKLATAGIELPLLAAGLWLYMRTTKARDAIGRWAFGGLAAFLVIAYVGNLASPPPPSVTALWITAIIGATMLALWSWWADKHRQVVLTIAALLCVTNAVAGQTAPLPTTIPIFPLETTMLFPGVSRPLHIFEPRYRAMVADALKGDRIIGMTTLKPGFEADYAGRPPIYDIGCAGVITDVEELQGGRYNIVLRCLVKFRVTSEDRSRPYRIAHIEAIPEVLDDADKAALRKARERLEALVTRGSDSKVPPDTTDEALVNWLAQYVQMTHAQRQNLLELKSVLLRARALIELIESKPAVTVWLKR